MNIILETKRHLTLIFWNSIYLKVKKTDQYRKQTRKAKKGRAVETRGKLGTKTICRAEMAGPASIGRQEEEALPDCCTKEALFLPYSYF